MVKARETMSGGDNAVDVTLLGDLADFGRRVSHSQKGVELDPPEPDRAQKLSHLPLRLRTGLFSSLGKSESF